MSNTDSKTDNVESFNWYLKTLKEEQDKKRGSFRSAQEEIDPKIEVDLLRLIKFFTPSVDRFMDLCKTELDVSLIEASKILDKLQNNKEIVIEEISKPSNDAALTPVTERIIKITDEGLKKI